MDTTEQDPHFEALLLHLKEQRGFDFTGYKRASLLRRVQRRMAEVGIADVETYRDHLEVHPDEFARLFDTVLINVTSFFRDADSWEYLAAEVLPPLLSAGRGPVRVWSAGCASGEEPYSVAMVLAEAMGLEDFRERVKIYATDVDEQALTTARAAVYPERALESVSAERRERWFERTASGYVVRSELRRSVIFGRNDLGQDAPISRVDLLLCRNTLMYFTAETQARIARRLHFALNPHGVLFLGKAEMLLSQAALFAPVELRRRFFRRAAASAGLDRRAYQTDALVPVTEHDAAVVRLRAEALLTAPAAQVVVAATGEVVASNARADLLFGLGERDVGRPFQDLELSYRPVELRSAIEEAASQRRPVWVRDVEWVRPGSDPVYLDVQVQPLVSAGGELLGTTVIFNDVTRHRELQLALERTNTQLATAYEELQSANEELETTNEELQSTVEELETTNEELQSTNEELETMNEELQSINDELNVTNEELRLRTLQVHDLNDFMEAVLTSLGTGVVVVDRDLRVMSWNDQATELWGVREDEASGRPLVELDIGLPMDDLVPLLHAGLLPDAPLAGGRLAAVNRRGRAVDVDVTVRPLRSNGGQELAGAILVMDVVD
ncbi:PAS domain-containing protein [Actinotalea ferrariae]|uniref:CheR family methyltransferase n=1 Tax=Actinotalea ferrariae TaxID=1386098 RepID=UPI001C8B2E45|nr:CheR family methyltransferase [Actinotalea ferrariae]MBX9243877.1 PAS domain-containing protein [Actinotalea ferrariae]